MGSSCKREGHKTDFLDTSPFYQASMLLSKVLRPTAAVCRRTLSTGAGFEQITIDVKDNGVALITLNRPKVRVRD